MEQVLNNFYNEIAGMVKTIVIKRNDLAMKNETTDSIKNFDLYYASLQGDRFLYNTLSYNVDILRKYLPTELMVQEAIHEVNSIPEEYRDAILTAQIEYNIESFEETNNYYRMLMGLPDTDDKNYIYTSLYPGYENIPIQDYPVLLINQMEQNGELNKIRLANPSKLYLNYLGVNSIDLIKARLARPFDILRMSSSDNTAIYDRFMKEYNIARRYIMVTSYNIELFTTNELYDGMMGFIILSLAINNTLSLDIEMYWDIEDMLDSMLESYGLLEYFRYIPFVYKRRLLLKMNKLLANKGTDSIFVDITEIFGYTSINIKRYYLVKKHSRKNDGTIIFPRLPDGSIDYDQLYELEFQKVDITADTLNYNNDVADYFYTTDNDPRWHMTDADVSELKKEDFSILMSKYISIDSIYELNSALFEMVYFTNLLMDLRNSTNNIRSSNMYSVIGESDLFTFLMMFITLICKKLEYDGNIIYEPVHVAEIYKFNITAMEETVQEIIDKYELELTTKDVLIRNGNPDMNSGDVMTYYNSLKNLYIKLMMMCEETTDYFEYVGLRELQKVLFVSTKQKEIFIKSNGESANTYLDMLYDLDSSIGIAIDEASSTTIDNMIIYVADKLETTFNDPSLRFLFNNIPSLSTTLIGKYLKQTIEVFKSSLVELTTIDTVFELDNSYTKLDRTIRSFCHAYTETDIPTGENSVIIDKVYTHTDIYVHDYGYSSDKLIIGG